jgi:hypothetical protein
MTGPGFQSATLSTFSKELENVQKTVMGLTQSFGQLGQVAAGVFGSAGQAVQAVGLGGSSGVPGAGPLGMGTAASGMTDFARTLSQVRSGELGTSPITAMRQLELQNLNESLAQQEQLARNMKQTGNRGEEYKKAKSFIKTYKDKIEETKSEIDEQQQIHAAEVMASRYKTDNPEASDLETARFLAQKINPSALQAMKDRGETVGPVLHKALSSVSHEEIKAINQVASVSPSPSNSATAGKSGDLYEAIRGKALYSVEDRMLASQGVALNEGRALGIDLTDVAGARAAQSKMNVPGLVSAATAASKSADPVVAALGRELAKVTENLKTFGGKVNEAADAYDKAVKGVEDGTATTEQATEAMKLLKKETLGLKDAQEDAAKIKKVLGDGDGTGTGEGSGFLKNAGKALAAVAGIGTTMWTTSQYGLGALYQEAAGKERSAYSSALGIQGLSESIALERADMTSPENLLKTRGDVLKPGKYKFLGDSNIGAAREIADRERSDVMKSAEHFRKYGLTEGAAQTAGGAMLMATGIPLLKSGVGAVAALPIMGAGLKISSGGLKAMAGVETGNISAQSQGGLAGGVVGRLLLPDSEFRAGNNAAAIGLSMQLDRDNQVNEMRNREVQANQLDLRQLREFQSFQDVRQQGAVLVGKYAVSRSQMMEDLYGSESLGATKGKTDIKRMMTTARTLTAATGSLLPSFDQSSPKTPEEEYYDSTSDGSYSSDVGASSGVQKILSRSRERARAASRARKATEPTQEDQTAAEASAAVSLIGKIVANKTPAAFGSLDYQSDTQNLTSKEDTLASRVGMSPTEFAAHRNMVTNVLGNRTIADSSGVAGAESWGAMGMKQYGITASAADTTSLVEMGRSGLGSFSQLMGNIGSMNQTAGGQNNIGQLKSVLTDAITAGFDKSRTAQQFVQTSLSIADSLRLTNMSAVSGALSTGASLGSATPGAMGDERSMRMAGEGIRGFNQWAAQQGGLVGASKMQGMLGAGADLGMTMLLKDATPAEGKEMLESLNAEGFDKSKITNPRLRRLMDYTGDNKDKISGVLKAQIAGPRGIVDSLYAAQRRGSVSSGLSAVKKDDIDSMMKFVADYSAAAGMTGMDRNASDQMAIERLSAEGKMSATEKKQLESLTRDTARATIDPAKVQSARFLGELMRAGEKDMKGITSDEYTRYLKSGGVALHTKEGRAIDEKTMADPKMKGEVEKALSDMNRYELAKGMEYSQASQAQSVRIENTQAVAEAIVIGLRTAPIPPAQNQGSAGSAKGRVP